MFFGLSELLFIVVFFGVGVLGSILWIWMVIECATREPSDSNDKIVWTIIIVFTHVIGALIYYFVRRPVRMAEIGK